MKSLLLLLSISFFSMFATAQDCATVNINGGNGQITISGLTGAPITAVQVFNSSWASVFNQTYNTPPGTVNVTPLTTGQYFVNVRFYNSNWSLICEKGGNATVTSGSPAPVDSCGSTFQKTFGLAPGSDEAYSIAKSVDGGFIAVGQSSVTGTTNYDGLVMKFDSKGTLLWSKTLGGAQQDFLIHVVATADGGCLAAGSTNSSGYATYTGDCWLVRLDGTGNILWQKRYFVSGNPGFIGGMTPTSDGGFGITGTFPFTPGASELMTIKIDANGNVVWQKKLGSASSDSGNGIIEDNHGGAGLITSAIVYLTNSQYEAVITKLDLVTGNVMWMKSYDFDGRSNWTGPIYKVSDGLIFNALNTDNFTSNNAKPGILKTDFNGNLLWMKEFTIPNCRDANMTVLPDESFLMVQSELPQDAASDLYLTRISAAGTIMWAKKYPKPEMQWLKGLASDGGNYVVGAGMMTVGSYSDVLLAKTDLNGKMGTCASTDVSATVRNAVVNNINFTWPTNTALNLTTATTTYTPATFSPVENVVCSISCPTVTVGNATVNENAGTANVQVCIAAPLANTVVYNYTTSNGTATSGSDYTGGSGTVTIPAGQTCGTISIPITNDGDVESAETFTVSVDNVSGTVTINDDDNAQGNCGAVTITPGSNVITVTGVTAPIATVQVFNASWATVFNQTYNNSPGTVNVPIAPGTYLVKVAFYNANWTFICDKSENVTVINNCPAGMICISNICPSQTVNLNNAYSVANLPAGTTVSWHTGTPATDANKMTDAEAQNISVSGNYYAAINISGAGCYSATIPVTVTIVACSSAATGEINSVRVQSADQPSARNIMLFPNPFTSSLRVIIDSEKKERAMIALMDVRGKELKQMPINLLPGSNTVLMEGLEKYPSGNYFLRITSGNGTKTLKVVRQQ
jgi:hypothetical protein